MKRLRIERWSGQLLSPRTRPCCLRQQQQQQQQHNRLQAVSNIRLQSTSARDIDVDDLPEGEFTIDIPPPPSGPSIPTPLNRPTYPSPTVQDALHSAKLAALHARLSLPKKLPIETMARTLVDASADPNIHFNNATLAQIGGNLMSYHVSEWLLCHYPRLPMTVLFAAAYAYNGPKTLKLLAHEWGVEAAAAPGDEVDPGFLQFDPKKAQPDSLQTGGQVRPDRLEYYRRGVSSRVVYDDDFGDTVPKKGERLDTTQATETAYSNFVKAVVGSIYLHAGRNAAKTFIQQHILSRNLSMSSLFAFKSPVRDLSRLCAREDFEFPVARLLSETGRQSISPVFVVGIFSGNEKLGEGAGPSLEEARIRASVAALKAWYLYSPGNNVRVPSDMEDKDNKLPWDPVYIDIGEII